jgi:hypothetical protein
VRAGLEILAGIPPASYINDDVLDAATDARRALRFLG